MGCFFVFGNRSCRAISLLISQLFNSCYSGIMRSYTKPQLSWWLNNCNTHLTNLLYGVINFC